MSDIYRSAYIASFTLVACLLINDYVGNVLPSLVMLAVGGTWLYSEFKPDGDAVKRTAAVEIIGGALIATFIQAFLTIDVMSFAVTFSAIALLHIVIDIVRSIWRRRRADTSSGEAAPEPA